MKIKKERPPLKWYPPAEERFNIISHTIGFILSLIGLAFLVIHACNCGNGVHILSFSIYGVSLAVVYLASTLYHRATEEEHRWKMKVFDHAAIFVLIAGTYTPFTLVSLEGGLGWLFFFLAWGFALAGVLLKMFFIGRLMWLSMIMYIGMGWMAVFIIPPLADALPEGGVEWIWAGGIAYTLGAVLYSIKRIKFNHAIWHALALIGSFCHFVSVYWYVLPTSLSSGS